MKMTTKDYNSMVGGFERLIPLAEKKFGSAEKYYKTVWLNVCKVSEDPKTCYAWVCFQLAKIHVGAYPWPEPYYNVITDNDYKHCHIRTAVRRYLKSKGFDYYDRRQVK